MPYKTTRELPEGVRGALPEHAQRIYMHAFNSSYDGDDGRAAQQAWGAVKNAGYRKGDKGWVRKSEDRLRCPHCRNSLVQKSEEGTTRVRASGAIEVDGSGRCTAQCYWCKAEVELPLQLRKAEGESEGELAEGERFVLREPGGKPPA